MKLMQWLWIVVALTATCARADGVEDKDPVGIPIETSNPDSAEQETAQLKQLDAMVAAVQQDVRPELSPPLPPPVIAVRRGMTEMVPIAAGHMNRFRTPFPNLRIEHRSTAVFKKEGSTFYISTDDTAPVSIFLVDRDAPDNAISLLLKPVANFAPVDVKLTLQGYEVSTPASAPAATAWETETPFVETVKNIFRSMASGNLPSGYGMRAWSAKTSPPVYCEQDGVAITPVQHVQGGNITVVVARVANRDAFPIEFEEESCAAPGVLAVAAWPNTRLAPGQVTEVFVAFRREAMEPHAVRRPSVLAGGQ